jgi:sugar phosphate isomerase/epimerase
MKLSVGAAYSASVYARYENGLCVAAPSFNDILKTIRMAAHMGYDAVELETLVKTQVAEVYTAANVKTITEVISEFGMTVPHFNAYSIIPALSGATLGERGEGIKSFMDVIAIAKGLGAHLLILSGSPIPGVKFSPGKIYSGGPPESVELPRDFDWNRTWQDYVEVIGECADMAQTAGLKLAIEPRPREIITNSDSLLRLISAVDRRNVGGLVDTAHLFIQKEMLPLAIRKLRGRIFGMHVADNDGDLEYHWTVGKGRINWLGVLQALKEIGYDEYLTVELEGTGVRDLEREYRESQEYLTRLITGQ